MTMLISEDAPRPGYWERSDSRFPIPMSRHLWELLTPASDEGIRRGFARYGCAVEYFDFALIRGRQYLRANWVATPEKRVERREIAEHVLAKKLWREDCGAWPALREVFRQRLLEFARRDPSMDLAELRQNVVSLREIFAEGSIQHFVQQPASMIPVGDWVRRTCEWTGSSTSEIIGVLQNCRSGLGGHLPIIDELAQSIRSSPAATAIIRDQRQPPAVRVHLLRQVSPEISDRLEAYIDEYADRIITGFDITDATLRELPGFTMSIVSSRLDGLPSKNPNPYCLEKLRDRVPPEKRMEFDEGLIEARTAYGLHDEDVRITYLWPLGLLRRTMRAAAERLVSSGALRVSEDVFQTTPEELDHLMAGGSSPSAAEISQRAEERRSWANEEPAAAFGERPPLPGTEVFGTACARITSAIIFYLAEMEGNRGYAMQSSPPVVQGLAASPGCYEGRARIVRSSTDFAKLSQGDVLVAQTTSPAYNVILPTVGAVVTDRGGTLCHAAIIAREFSIPAVVGTNQATAQIPDGARVFVDGDHGFVAVRP